nr:peptidoglycan DD-metalloendopeptidase family protein [Bradyrhizobium japonicum]
MIEPPEDGHRAGGTSDFGADRDVGTTPHVGVDMNRGRGVLPHGSVASPVYGKVTEVHPALGRIVIEEWDPIRKEPTGYYVEILHTQTQNVKPKDEVIPRQQIGTQGDVGARGAFHAHIQVLHGADRTPINPLRHLFEYHNPGEPVPPLRQFQPERLPPRLRNAPTSPPANQGRPTSDRASGVLPERATPSQFSPSTAIPGAEGPTSIGGPAGPRPLSPAARPQSAAPRSVAPPADPGLPPLHFKPEAPRNSGPFTVPGPFRSDASDRQDISPATSGPRTRISAAYPGSSSLQQPAFPLKALFASDRGRALDQWASSSFSKSVIPPPSDISVGPITPAGRSNPDQASAGGILGMIQEYLRNNAY